MRTWIAAAAAGLWLVAGAGHDADDSPGEVGGQMIAQQRDGPALSRQHDPLHTVPIDQSADRARGRLVVLVAVLLDVPLIPALGERGPSPHAVPALDRPLERDLLDASLRAERQQPGVGAVDEHDQRGHHLVGRVRQRSEVRRAAHDERVLQRHLQGQDLA